MSFWLEIEVLITEFKPLLLSYAFCVTNFSVNNTLYHKFLLLHFNLWIQNTLKFSLQSFLDQLVTQKCGLHSQIFDVFHIDFKCNILKSSKILHFFKTLLRHVLKPSIWSVLVNIFRHNWKAMYSPCACFQMSVAYGDQQCCSNLLHPLILLISALASLQWFGNDTDKGSDFFRAEVLSLHGRYPPSCFSDMEAAGAAVLEMSMSS